MKELNNFRKFLSENALGVDKGDGTFEITPDFQIMGQSFNFSDICPSAHKLVQNQAIVHQGFSRTAPTVLMFAILHRDFFALERKALGAAGITVDDYKNDVTRLYTEILNVAEKLGVRKQAKKYMDMHMAKIKDAGFKASEPGGSSDRNFEEGHEPTDKELDYADEIEYEQDWKDEQDDLFGKIREVRTRIASEVEGYTDLHENDVALEAFLGESNAEMNPLRGIKNSLPMVTPGFELDFRYMDDLGYAKAIKVKGDVNIMQFFTENPQMYKAYARNIQRAKDMGVDVDLNTNVLDAYNAISAAAREYELREDLNLKEEIEMVEPQRGHDFYKLNRDVELELKTGFTSPTMAPKVLLHPVFGKKITARKGQYIISFFGQLHYVDMDEKFATRVSKHEDNDNIKNLRGALDPVDMAPKFKGGWDAYLNKPLEEATKPDEKAIKALAAKLMKNPKYKAKYKGKKGAEFVSTAMADAEKQLKGK